MRVPAPSGDRVVTGRLLFCFMMGAQRRAHYARQRAQCLAAGWALWRMPRRLACQQPPPPFHAGEDGEREDEGCCGRGSRRSLFYTRRVPCSAASRLLFPGFLSLHLAVRIHLSRCRCHLLGFVFHLVCVCTEPEVCEQNFGFIMYFLLLFSIAYSERGAPFSFC